MTKDYDMSIHTNPDAQAWAKFFIQTKKEASWQIEDIDESLMLGWFANAMMAMHDHLKSQRTEQEPVAYCDPSDPISSTAFSWPETGRNPSHTHTTSLFTSPAQPPQRTWVGLTEEDMKGMSYGDKVLAARVARTLKEKNT